MSASTIRLRLRLQVLNSFKQRLRSTESDLAESKKQNAELSIQIQQLVSKGPQKPSSRENRANDRNNAGTFIYVLIVANAIV